MAQGLSSWVNPSAYMSSYRSGSPSQQQQQGSPQQLEEDSRPSSPAAPPRESGGKRARIASALRYANQARQDYIASYYRAPASEGHPPSSGTVGGEWTDRDIQSSTGLEEMVLFPSYARQRKRQPNRPTSPQRATSPFGMRRSHSPGYGHGNGGAGGVRTPGWGETYHESPNPPEDKTLVEVDVRGWIFLPPSNVLTRKNRFLMGVARQLCGLPAKVEEKIEAAAAEVAKADPAKEQNLLDVDEAFSDDDNASVRSLTPPLRQSTSTSSFKNERGNVERETGLQPANMKADSEPTPGIVKKLSWGAASYARSYLPSRNSSTANLSNANGQSAAQTGLTSKELDTAHEFLRHRMFHVMARASPNIPVTIFLYNSKTSHSRTILTDAYGQFTIRAPLPFIPTHVRVLASERLSVTEEIRIVESHGLSLISDIDDTIKNSAVTMGVREMARNVFIRDYGTLTIPGITELYNTLAFLDVPIHYVSNSPWQLYPLIREYFKAANLPSGSFHLKQYQSVFQGIFEPVADRKKSSLERILQDFPDRRFIMVGDSGEADLEVYLGVALANPGRIMAIFIRDVTTKEDGEPLGPGFFESNYFLKQQRLEVAQGNGSQVTLRQSGAGAGHGTPVAGYNVEERPPPPRRPATIAEPRPFQRHTVYNDDLADVSSSDDDEGPTVLKPMEGHTLYPTSSSSTPTPTGKKPPPPPPKKPSSLKYKNVTPGTTPTERTSSHLARSPPRSAPININRQSQEDLIDIYTDSENHSITESQRSAIEKKIRNGSPHSPPGKSPSPPKVWKGDTSSVWDHIPRNAVPPRPGPGGGFASTPNLGHGSTPPAVPPKPGRMDSSYGHGSSNRPRGGSNEVPRFTIRPPTDSEKSSTNANSNTSSSSSSSSNNQPVRRPTAPAAGGGGGGPHPPGVFYGAPSAAGSHAAVDLYAYDPASGVDKKEWLYRVRWEKARVALEEQGMGVLLMSWRKGGDILETAVRVVEEAKGEMDRRFR